MDAQVLVAPPDDNDVAEYPEAAMEGCMCNANDAESEMSWKCGNEIYVCPNVQRICDAQGSVNSVYYSITQTQCDDMKAIEINQECIQLPQHGITAPKDLSNRVCYKNVEHGLGYHGMKNDGNCEACKDSFQNNAIKGDEEEEEEEEAMEAPNYTRGQNNNKM